MANMHDHDRIEEIQAHLAGLLVGLDEVVSGLEELAVADPAIHGKLAGHLVAARAVMVKAQVNAEHARGVGEERWRQSPGRAERG